jgi:hypothetical protein
MVASLECFAKFNAAQFERNAHHQKQVAHTPPKQRPKPSKRSGKNFA